MTDRELLEMAAKAAGIPLHELDDTYGDCGGIEKDGWNPLIDDGDALRLAMALCIDIVWCNSGRVIAIASAGDRVFEAVESSREDRGGNTRRAIVRAAASIGKDMA